MNGDLLESVERLQRDLQILQGQVIVQFTEHYITVMFLYTGLLTLTVLTMRLVVGCCRAIGKRIGGF